MILLRFSYLIIIANFLFFLVGFTNNIGIVGSYLGFLGAIGTDPIIIFYAIIIGAGLVVHQSKFSILYFILAAVVGAAAAHYFLGTKMFIIDVVRFDALLIMPAFIVIVASFFTPKSKAIKTETIKLDPPTLKGIRILVLIFGAAISGFILFADTTGGHHRITDTFFGKYVSKSLVKPFHMERTLRWCKDRFLKSSCFNYGESQIFNAGVLTVVEINEQLRTGQIKVQKEKSLKSTYKITMWVVHILLFIISMVAVFKLRFCIVHVLLTRTRHPEKKGTSNIIKSINKFFKSI
ncbi:hypothetical protein OAD73_03795 [Candidatus Pelagibacter sp.]|nr:hypothetical protein [Candidatus Pelagibacter sp.]